MSERGGPLLDAGQVRGLLTELGAWLSAQGIEARLFLVRGAAMALAFSRRRITRDLDAVFEPKAQIYAVAAELAAEHHLPEDWLNDGVKGLLPDRVAPMEGTASFSAPGIHVGVAAPEYLFAMKAMAARQETDGADLRVLAADLQLRDAADALALVERFYGPGRLTIKTQLLLEDILGTPTARTEQRPDRPLPAQQPAHRTSRSTPEHRPNPPESPIIGTG